MRVQRYAKRTIETYLHWIKFYILFHHKQHPSGLGEHEVEQFLSYLANSRHVAVKTQATALNALVFLYRHILDRPLTLNLNFSPRQCAAKVACGVNSAGNTAITQRG